MRRLVEGEPAARGGRSPTRSLAPAPGLRGGGGGWHPPGNQLGQVPAASAARATPSLASSPPRLALAAAASLRGNCISVSKRATVLEEASAFNPARRPFDSGPLMPEDSARPRQAAVKTAPLAERRGDRDRAERNTTHV
uniref:Uncharacterized protein n=1 Tax=Rangifer tarandus platyrhynchus TaxID=3082113 RepID=A0ACB0FGF1_RANTA|nr:unnamed protein product [Rangifer tarandus platyrhynchus]